MEQKKVSFTRQQLYDQVWSMPMIKFAEKYGLSDRGMAKICKKHNIPCPPRGYWAKLHAGRKVKKIPLPAEKNSEIISLRTGPFEKSKQEKIAHFVEEHLTDPVLEVPVKEDLRSAHPLIREISNHFKTLPKKAKEMLVPSKGKYLDITVSPNSLRRALLIMDSVLNTLESNGFPISVSNDGTTVDIFDVKIAFLLKEEYKTVPKKRKSEEEYEHWNSVLGKRGSYNSYDYDRVPSGILCLSIDEWRYGGHGTFQKNWRDTKTLVLEDRLSKFVSGLIQIAAKKSEKLRIEKEKERIRQEQKRILQQRIDEYKKEKMCVEVLFENADKWKNAHRLRLYIAEVEKCLEQGRTFPFIDGNPDAWLNWAYIQADRLDPLKSSTPSILDDEDLEIAIQRQKTWYR